MSVWTLKKIVAMPDPHARHDGSKTTLSSATARRPRWSAATDRSTGSAGPGSIRAPASRPSSATPEHGRWLITPMDSDAAVTRRYLDGSLVLVTTFETADGDRRTRGFHAAARRQRRSRPPGSRRARPCRSAHRVHSAVRLRLDRAVGRASRSKGLARDRRARNGSCCGHRCRCNGEILRRSANSLSATAKSYRSS